MEGKFTVKSVKTSLEKAGKMAKDILFPPSCPMCDSVMSWDKCICDECSGKIRYIGEPKCKRCGKQLAKEEAEYCNDCLVNKHYYKSGIAAFVYNDVISKSIYRFKYHNRRGYAEFYGRTIADKYRQQVNMWGADVIMPVPIHEKKLIKRGYNQAELLAKELGNCLQLPVDKDALVRVIDTKPQKEMDKGSRKKNLEKAFKIRHNVVKYSKVILVDDIYTTGSTIDECAKTLLESGILEVYFISLSIGAGI